MNPKNADLTVEYGSGLASLAVFVAELAVTANGCELLPTGNRHSRTILVPGEGVQDYELQPPALTPTVFDLESLFRFASYANTGAIYVCDESVVLVLNDSRDSHRDDRVTLPLTPSAEWLTITKFAQKLRTQAEFIDFLQDECGDTVLEASPNLLTSVRSLKFRTLDEQNNAIGRGRESLGKSVEAEVAGLADADYQPFTVSVTRWRRVGLPVQLKVRLVVDFEQRKIALRPLGGEVDFAEDTAIDELMNAIVSEVAAETPVLFGKP